MFQGSDSYGDVMLKSWVIMKRWGGKNGGAPEDFLNSKPAIIGAIL